MKPQKHIPRLTDLIEGSTFESELKDLDIVARYFQKRCADILQNVSKSPDDIMNDVEILENDFQSFYVDLTTAIENVNVPSSFSKQFANKEEN